MSNVPTPQFTPNGLVVPPESEVRAGWWADFQGAFGGNLNPSDATPQGQLVTALSAISGAGNDLFLEYVNQVDPARADGRMQEAIARIYYLERLPAVATVVTATCTGAEGTTIAAGALAQATDGTIYQCLSPVTIPSTGSIAATFQAIVTGPIQCPAGALNAIYRVIPGWDAITNAADGTPGRDVETRADFEARRAASVAKNASGILGAIKGAVLDVPGVLDAYVTENATGSSATMGGVSVAARSVYVAVYGGANADIARAIWTKKAPGCAYTGDTTVDVADTGSGYSLPYPTYSVKFQRATALPIHFAIAIADNGLVPADAEASIKDAVIAAFNGADGGPRAKIGATLYALRFAAPVQSVGSWCQVVSIAIGTTSSPSDSELAVDIDKMPTISAANIAVTLV
ncbi:baseplate J/gp47 family protein [Novosphingobium colocasiae]|uniref:baseplate J/gp47 family protein n=1 Tax=Novosphingobium colocasiae TaxID=1256513 RepID=UPI0035B264FB